MEPEYGDDDRTGDRKPRKHCALSSGQHVLVFLPTSALAARAEADDAARRLQARGSFDWTPPEDFSIQFEGLDGELFIGGVYVRLFLRNPGFPLREPKVFLEGLLKVYLAEVAEGSAAARDRALLVAAAAVELLRNHTGLVEHAVTLGYVDRLLKLLSARLASTGGISFPAFTACLHTLDGTEISGKAL